MRNPAGVVPAPGWGSRAAPGEMVTSPARRTLAGGGLTEDICSFATFMWTVFD